MKILPWRLLAGLAIALVATTTSAQPATTQRAAATTPTTHPAADIERCWEGLADVDSGVREASMAELLLLSRGDLPTLQKIVAATKAVALPQAAALRDIVLHVYLSGETYSANSAHGFLGLMGPGELYTGSVIVETQEDPAADDDSARRQGVRVNERVPGFNGYSHLQTGDILLALEVPSDQPENDQQGETKQDIRDWVPFTLRVAEIRPGTVVTFEVLRRGKIIKVPIKLGARPTWAGEEVELMLQERTEKFERYWREHFAPLIGETVL